MQAYSQLIMKTIYYNRSIVNYRCLFFSSSAHVVFNFFSPCIRIFIHPDHCTLYMYQASSLQLIHHYVTSHLLTSQLSNICLTVSGKACTYLLSDFSLFDWEDKQ